MSLFPEPFARIPPPLRARLRAALRILLQAFDHASQANADPWEFAVPMADLLALGWTTSDLQWLYDQGYVQHAVVLTEAGATAARLFRPSYNRDLRQLCVGGRLIKELTRPAPDQLLEVARQRSIRRSVIGKVSLRPEGG